MAYSSATWLIIVEAFPAEQIHRGHTTSLVTIFHEKLLKSISLTRSNVIEQEHKTN